MTLAQKEKDALIKLAYKYMKYASLPVHKEKLNLWKALNRLKMERPMVLIDQLPWNELIPEGDYAVSDPYWRGLEANLRKTIYKWEHFPVDMVLEPFIVIPSSARLSGFGLDISDETIKLHKNETASSHRYIRQLEDMADIEKIKDMHVTVDRQLDERRLYEAVEIFGGEVPTRLSHGLTFNLGVWDSATQYMGVENIYIDLMDRPEFLHAVIERFTSSLLNGIDEANALHVHDDTASYCHCSHIYTDDLLSDFGAGKGSVSENCWAYGLAQLFSSVSPAITEEFELPYITRLAEKFGSIYYGCCDRLDDRLDIVKKIPRVRKFSCSPWSDREKFAQNLGPDYVMSNKPTPAYIAAGSVDWDTVRDDLKRTLDAAKANNVCLEFILKDISTVDFKPERLTRWADIAMDLCLSW